MGAGLGWQHIVHPEFYWVNDFKTNWTLFQKQDESKQIQRQR